MFPVSNPDWMEPMRATHSRSSVGLPCIHENQESCKCRNNLGRKDGISMKMRMNPGRMLIIALTLAGATPAMAKTGGAGAHIAPPRPKGPCDIYAAAGDPCVAAYSTTRALYAAYNGPLYQVIRLGVKANGIFARVSLGGTQVAATFGGGSNLGWVHLRKEQPVKLEVMCGYTRDSHPEAQLIWAPISNKPDPAAIAAAKDADVVIAVVGITSRLESEEAPVDQPGFFGGDRTNLKIPHPEEALVRAVAATGKPLVVVLMNGSCLAAKWEKQHASAILEAWYSGEEGGAAIADTLSGKNDPGGRLPVTFYQSVHQLPPFEDYSMGNRTYRYFNGEPLWPFGYGLSYTTFSYSDLTLPQTTLNAGAPVDADVTVTNTGKVAGDEVVELYLKFPPVAGAPRIALRGFQRIHLQPGERRQVHFKLQNRDLSMVTEAGQPIIAGGDYTISIGGGQPGTGAPEVTGHFHIDGNLSLSE
jgi:beta-glucosidase